MKKILEYIPLIYASLIFLGYINLQTYYWWFGINIYNYTDTGEILLSFLEVILYLFLFAFCALLDFFAFICYVGTGLANEVNKLSLNLLKYKKSNTNILIKAIVIAGSKFIGGGLYLLNGFLLQLCYGGVLFLSGIFFSYQVGPDIGFSNFFQLSVFFLLCFSLIIILLMRVKIIEAISKAVSNISKKISEKDDNYNVVISNKKFISEKKYVIIILFMYYILFTCYFNYLKAKTVLADTHIYNVEFDYYGEKIKSNDIIYIGQIQEYLFLRDNKKEENLMFSKKDISNLKIGRYHKFKDIGGTLPLGTGVSSLELGTCDSLR